MLVHAMYLTAWPSRAKAAGHNALLCCQVPKHELDAPADASTYSDCHAEADFMDQQQVSKASERMTQAIVTLYG